MHTISTLSSFDTIDSLTVAEFLGIDHRSHIRTVKKYLDKLERFGKVRFEITPSGKTNQALEVAHYNENQALLIGTLSKNTEEVIDFKVRLVAYFDKVRNPQPAPMQLPQSYAEALRLAADLYEQKEQLAANYQKALPKVEFADKVHFSINGHTIRQAAKELGTGEKRLFQWLYSNRYLISSSEPYQHALESGWVKIQLKTRKDPCTGEIITYSQVLVTGKGLQYFSKRYFDPCIYA